MLEKLIEHMHWADARLLAWMQDGAHATPETLRLLSHVLNVERVWITRAGGAQGDRDTFKVRPLAELAALEASNHADFAALAKADAQRVVEYRLFNGTPGKSSVEDMILHAFSHGFHHVGQIAALAAGSGEGLPDLSYLGFTRTQSLS